MPESLEAREAAHGQRMIEIKVRFWTNDIAEGRAQIAPKHAWDSGVVRIDRNDSHGIVPTAPEPFNGLAELPAKIEKVLIQNGIRLHLVSRAKKYIVRD